jgi:membrane dipeptidase
VRRLLLGAVALALLATGGLVLLGARIEGWLNRVEGPPLPPVAAEAQALHRTSLVVDLHADPLLWGRDLLVRGDTGHVDLPRLREGGVGLQVFGVVTRVPIVFNIERTDARWPDAITLLALARRWPAATLGSRRARVLHQAAALARLAEAEPRRFQPVRARRDLDYLLAMRARDPGVVGGLLALEGAHALDDDLDALPELVDAGVRMIGLAHFFDNAFAGSAHGVAKGGLTPLGRALVEEMERRGVVLDLAHASEAAMREALALARKPPVVSHTGVRGTCDNPRNLSDDQIRAIAAAGGVIGIGVWETAVCGVAPGDVARAVRYVVDLVGDEHAALGTDFDGAVTAGFDASGLPAVTQALLAAGLSEESVRKVLGANALRVLRAVLPDES